MKNSWAEKIKKAIVGIGGIVIFFVTLLGIGSMSNILQIEFPFSDGVVLYDEEDYYDGGTTVSLWFFILLAWVGYAFYYYTDREGRKMDVLLNRYRYDSLVEKNYIKNLEELCKEHNIDYSKISEEYSIWQKERDNRNKERDEELGI